MQTFASGSIFLGADTDSQPPQSMSFRRSNRLAAVAVTQVARRSATAEERLWSSILVALYRDIAREGPYLGAYRDARRAQPELDEVVAALGYPAGTIEKLIVAAVGEWSAGQRVVQQILAR